GRLLQWTQAIYQHLFTRIPSKVFHSPMLAFEFIHFCKDSLPLFGRNRGILRLSFPNLCKSCSASLTPRPGCALTCCPGSPLTLLSLHFLAWNNPPLTSEFVVLLPVLADTGTTVEMLHATAGHAGPDRSHGPATQRVSMRTGTEPGLISPIPASESSLGCLFTHRSSPGASEKPLWDSSLRAPSCLEALRDPQCQPIFQYLLQATASGTTERLAPLHQLLQPMASCALVVQCTQAVPTPLQAFFLAVTKHADRALANQLALLLLERSNLMYQAPQYEAHMHRRQPSLVVELAKELLEFVGSASGPLSAGLMHTSVVRLPPRTLVPDTAEPGHGAEMCPRQVWAIGEYLAVPWDLPCTVQQINRFFEVLEALLFEVTQCHPSSALPKCPPQVATILMTMLTKLASWSQVLIPRDCPGVKEGALGLPVGQGSSIRAEAALLGPLVPWVSLLLSKMTTLAESPSLSSVRCEDPSGAVCRRATELLNLLKMPSMAQFMFTASMEVSQPHFHHEASTALPLALCIVSRLVEKEAGLLPGEGPVTRGAPAGSQIKSLVSSQAVVPVLREESRTLPWVSGPSALVMPVTVSSGCPHIPSPFSHDCAGLW
ncbi:hypothetical protein MC885_014868, partial [Smutsia gigantea]